MRAHRPVLVLPVIALLATATPSQALSHHGWARVSDAGVLGLATLALGRPLATSDMPGALQAGESLMLGGGTAYALKQLVHEQRPDGSGNDSFPSAHTSFSFAAAATMQRRYGWEAGLPATAAAALVGIARVKADKHHWYDVVAGAAIGEGAGLLLTRPHDARVQFMPWGDGKAGGATLSMRF